MNLSSIFDRVFVGKKKSYMAGAYSLDGGALHADTARAIMPARDSLTVEAPAKLNLFLEINGKRADGYHLLRSIAVPVSLCDTVLMVRTRRGVETTVALHGLPAVAGNAVGDSHTNLATRAANLLQEVTGYRGGASIHITKRIPVGGGLGGGSADAAAVLTGLNRLWGLGLSLECLMAMGARLGSDVPMLVLGRAARMEGAGEKVSPLPGITAAWWLVLVNPGFPVSTADIYRRFTSPLTSSVKVYNNLLSALRRDALDRASSGLYNALEDTVYSKYPLLAIIAARLAEEGAAGVMLAGSGASIFALAENRRYAQVIDRRIRGAMGMWLWSAVARMLPDGVTGSTRPFGGHSLGSSPSRAARG